MKIEDMENEDELLKNLESLSDDDLKIIIEFYTYRLEIITEILDKTAVNVVIDGIFSTSHNMTVFNVSQNGHKIEKLTYETLCDAIIPQIEIIKLICNGAISELNNRGVTEIIINDTDICERLPIVLGLANIAKEKYERLTNGISLKRFAEKVKARKEEP